MAQQIWPNTVTENTITKESLKQTANRLMATKLNVVCVFYKFLSVALQFRLLYCCFAVA